MNAETKKSMPSRRRWLLTGAAGAAAVAGAAILRPGAHGGAHLPYFRLMAQALQEAGIATPTLVIDKTRLLANQIVVRKHLAAQKMSLRLVAKSLPCLSLLDVLMAGMQSKQLMQFNLPYLQLTAEKRGDCDILLGKPMPVAAAAQFYREFKGQQFQPEKQLQWLVDSPARMAQYRDLARGQNLQMKINLELDVGLHRGGFADAASLQQALQIIKSEPRLHYAGMMGYDAHVSKIPDVLGAQANALAFAKQQYRQMAAQAETVLGKRAGLCMNTAGSPSYRLHDAHDVATEVANEVAIGSAFVKPSDFDTDLLQDLQPACFIATPVLKAGQVFQMPHGVEFLADMQRAWDVNSRHGYFIYGGNWLADPVSPLGLKASSLYGTSSNQQLFLGDGQQQLRADEMMFFRPRQSEAVLQQFGAIAVYEIGRITERWEVFPAQA